MLRAVTKGQPSERCAAGCGQRTRQVYQLGFEPDAAIAYVRVNRRVHLSAMLLLLRIVGVWFLLLAMVAAVIDATKSLAAGGAWVFTPLGQQWATLNPDSLATAKSWVETHAGTFMWNPMITEILNAPTWVKRTPAEVFIN
jgi:hypothetical protein